MGPYAEQRKALFIAGCQYAFLNENYVQMMSSTDSIVNRPYQNTLNNSIEEQT